LSSSQREKKKTLFFATKKKNSSKGSVKNADKNSDTRALPAFDPTQPTRSVRWRVSRAVAPEHARVAARPYARHARVVVAHAQARRDARVEAEKARRDETLGDGREAGSERT
jgi:hypothetical protein